MLLAVSCSTNLHVEKRHYTKGFYVEANVLDKTRKKSNLKDNFNSDKRPIVTETAFYYQSEKNTDELSMVAKKNIKAVPEVLTASINKTDFTKPVHINSVKPIDSNNVIKKGYTLPIRIPFLNKIINKYSTSQDNVPLKKSSRRGKALIIVGTILSSLGFYVFMWTSMIGGIVLMTVGLVLLIIGAVRYRQSVSSAPPKDEFEEVVYLKNGSIIKCVVLEEVIDDYVKIQMRDGSIFVYKMTEVEKITKEKKTN